VNRLGIRGDLGERSRRDGSENFRNFGRLSPDVRLQNAGHWAGSWLPEPMALSCAVHFRGGCAICWLGSCSASLRFQSAVSRDVKQLAMDL
jgi:hypothetical protein